MEVYKKVDSFQEWQKLQIHKKLKKFLYLYNSLENITRTEVVMSSANQIKDIYIENLDKILERGEKLENLQKKTDKLL